jgi:hypothetical protein
LKPIRARHITAGVKLVDAARFGITVEAYQKRYSDYPVASEYPQLSLANIADTFGQAFLMFPMTGKGIGVARGVETSIESKPISRLLLTGTITYSRNWFSGLNGVLRRGNFDLPLVANLGANWRLGRSTSLTLRYSAASGRPYTPDNLALSFAQNRDVYDLTRINAVRAATYSRLDFRLSHSHVFDRRVLTWHAGLVNAFGTTNFYSNQWRPRCPTCGVLEQGQMPLLPDAGIQYSF